MPKSFHDLVVFKLAMALADEVYDATADFPKSEIYGLSAQLRRAAVGVFSQIAEGTGRVSYGEWRQFLSQARGSLFEVEAQARFAARRGLINQADITRLERSIRRVSRALAGLIVWINERERCREKRRVPRD